MSSVTRFIRQIPVSTTYYDAASVIGSAAAITNAYQFVPDASNYVGNYPPGYMTQASASSPNTTGASLYGLLLATINYYGTASQTLVLRDMGKTIKARYDVAGVLGTNEGYFREVQLLNPRPLGTAAGTSVIGGVNGSTFGVIGVSPDYLSFYIPVTVAGVRGPVPTLNAYAIAGGQM